ncbi:MAG: T9SS type A sorting domain-containing protein, partial [Calditrichales bacterium]|nr:T9SS type A sorting domain-containing protein [Calditrichales bacterium]
MKKYYFHLIILLTAVSFAFSADKYNFSWSSLANNSGLISSLKTMDASALPDSINQIKNVRAGIDLDKDGKKEFMFPAVWVDDDGVTARRSIFLYENTGNNSYDLVWSYQFPGVADQFTTVDVSDLDGDGNQEILAVNVPAEGDNGANLYVFEYTGADNDYGSAPVVTWDLGSVERDIVRVAKAADFDGDGKQEVVMTCYTTQPAIVIASVSDFSLPVWTTEYINNEIGGTAPDIAAIGVGDMDNDATPEIVLTEGATDKLLIIEATAANTYSMNEVDMPVAGKTVSVHSIEMGDINGDGKDEAFIANLQGTVWVVTAPGDVLAITTSDIHAIATTDQQWLEAGLGDLGLGGFDFVIAASNGSTAEDYRYVGGNGGDVTDSTNYVSETVVSLADVEAIVPGGVRVYGLDFAGDMDDDGLPEIIFTRGSSRGGKDCPAIFIMEITSKVTGLADLFNAIPKKLLLHQNYPNPFNPSTIIKYAVNKPTNVKVTVYDALGQKVATLVNEYQT